MNIKKIQKPHRKTIAIDFDGVIHKYSRGFVDGTIYDEPFKNVFMAIDSLMIYYNVFIFSSRSPRKIKKWLDKQWQFDEAVSTMCAMTCQIIPFWYTFWNKRRVLGITRKKLPAHIYIDDRAYKFTGDWNNTFKDITKLLSN